MYNTRAALKLIFSDDPEDSLGALQDAAGTLAEDAFTLRGLRIARGPSFDLVAVMRAELRFEMTRQHTAEPYNLAHAAKLARYRALYDAARARQH